MKNSRLVYSTETDRICPKCRKPASSCSCGKKGKKPQSPSPFTPDGIIRIRRETKGRRGKTVTAVFGFTLDDAGLRALAKQLKQHCGTGGSIKDGIIAIQGDHREAIERFLTTQGFKVKMAGG
jgi:translation initiation factor 1